MPRNRLAINPETAQKIIASYNSGKSMSEVGIEFGVAIQTVCNLLKASGHKARQYTRKNITNRRCLCCKERKPLDDFPGDKTRAGMKGYRCRACVKEAYRRTYLIRVHGITTAEYDDMLAKQGGKCRICKNQETTKGNKYLAVDHCHKTLKIRGLLCRRCNTAIGLFADDPGLMMKAILHVVVNMPEFSSLEHQPHGGNPQPPQ